MSNRYVIEALLRPAVEFNTAVVAATAAGVCVTAHGRWRLRLRSVMSQLPDLAFWRLSVSAGA